MKLGALSIWCGMVVAAAIGTAALEAAQPGARGTIRGHVRLQGELPGNPVIRMTRDPMCARINAGKRVVQETVLAALDGSMANVFVHLTGSFPETPVPTAPVTIMVGSYQPGAKPIRSPMKPRMPITRPSPPRTAAQPQTPMSWRMRGGWVWSTAGMPSEVGRFQLRAPVSTRAAGTGGRPGRRVCVAWIGALSCVSVLTATPFRPP